MTLSIPVDDILARVPLRARMAYTNLLTHPDTVYDHETGWSSAYIGQHLLAQEMECSLSTVKRSLVDLRQIGIVRVLAWPGARTETHLRVGDVSIGSIFGPIVKMQAELPHEQAVDLAVLSLRDYWARFDREIRQARDTSTEPST